MRGPRAQRAATGGVRAVSTGIGRGRRVLRTRSPSHPPVRSRYPQGMSIVTAESAQARAVIAARRDAIDVVLRRYGAVNPRLFGSVARGDARSNSDLDLLVDLMPGVGNVLLRVSGLAEDLSEVLGVRVDVVCEPLMRDDVSASARADAVPL